MLPTPSGNILRSLVESGVQVGISSRSWSVREQNGQTIVEDDFQLICFDMVSEPLNPRRFYDARAQGATNESRGEVKSPL